VVSYFDDPGCNLPGDDDPAGHVDDECFQTACAYHDACYFGNGCDASSWYAIWRYAPLIHPCQVCNEEAAINILLCEFGIMDLDNPCRPNRICFTTLCRGKYFCAHLNVLGCSSSPHGNPPNQPGPGDDPLIGPSAIRLCSEGEWYNWKLCRCTKRVPHTVARDDTSATSAADTIRWVDGEPVIR
jgi:hypothetical protein